MQCVEYRDCIGHQSNEIKTPCIPTFNTYKSCLLGGENVYLEPASSTDPCAPAPKTTLLFVVGLVMITVALLLVVGAGYALYRRFAKREEWFLVPSKDPEEVSLQELDK